MAPPPPGTTELRVPTSVVAWTYGLLAGGGAVVGGALHAAREWLLSLDVLPWRAAVSTVDSVLDGLGPWGLPVLAAAGAVLGALVAAAELEKEPRIDVAHHQVVVARGKSRRTYPRGDVREALHDAGDLVLLAENGTELVRATTSVPADALERAFRAAGYRWDTSGTSPG
jgi:hypothetical protein